MKFDYGYFNPFIGMGAIAMTGFFMLSGYSLFITYNSKDLSKLSEIKSFYLKRFIGVYPIYYVISIAYVILIGKESLIQNVLLAPISFLGIQSVFSDTFSISHVGGTWFISCITLCYLVYPYIQIVIRQLGTKGNTLIIAICSFILLWSPIFRHGFHLPSYYDNPFIRLLEFTIGMVIANLNRENADKFVRLLQSGYSLTLGVLGLFIFTNLALFLHIGNGDYMLYDWIALPAFIMIIMPLGKMSFPKIQHSRFILYLSAISYEFFLAQFFLWPICRKIFLITGIDGNLSKIAVSLALCFAIAIFMHEIIVKPVSKYLRNKAVVSLHTSTP